MSRPLRILHVEDVDDDALLVARRLRKAGYDLTTQRVDNREDMARALASHNWDLVLCDHSLPNFDIASALELIAQSGLDLPLIIVSGAINEDSAVAAMKAGARDFVMKDNLTRLIPVIEREMLTVAIRKDKRKIEDSISESLKLNQLVENTPIDQILREALEKAVKLTESEIGYLHFFDSAKQTILLNTWSEGTLKKCAADKSKIHYPIQKAGVWADCIRQREPVVHNDYRALADKKGMPEGHVSVIRDLAVPVIEGESVVAVLGVGNKSAKYDQLDIELVSQIAGTVWSVVRRKRAEEAVGAQLSFLQKLIETMPAAIFFKDKQGVYQGCNTLFAKWLGKSREEEVKGHTAFDLLPPTSAYLHNQMDQKLLIKGGSTQYETSRDDEGGKERKILAHKATYTDQAGNISGIVGVLLDITELKQAEEARKELESQLRQAQKLEAIGTLAGGIAHDFNNILAAIVGFSELAYGELKGQEKAKKYVEQVLSASDRAKNLTKQILTFSRKSEQEIQPVNVGLIAKEALKLLRATLPPSIEMEINIDSQASLVIADPTQIHQVLMNLCTNAAHAMRDAGGTLGVAVSAVEMSSDDLKKDAYMQPGQYVKIEVADTGKGIHPSILDRIFDPYFTTKAVGEGTGLGLSVVHGIIKGLGGSIGLWSKVDQGTTFYILIPSALQEPDSVPITYETDPMGDESIMLVDDENALNDILSSQLNKLGYQVKSFKSGDEAWAFFQENPDRFDAVITDLLMPGMPGRELAEKIKASNENLPVIIHTGFSECLLDEESLHDAVDAVCLKPIHAKELASVLRNLLDGMKY